MNSTVQSGRSGSAEEPAAPLQANSVHKPIWEVFQEISATVPDEVWNNMPTDLAEQHDHYVYGTPKNIDR